LLGRGFTVARLKKELSTRARQLKPLLLDQSVIAGLGNIYADESLFRAGLHPRLRSSRLSDGQIAALHEAIQHVLRKAIRYRGTSFDRAYLGGSMQRRLMVYGRDGEPCRACGTAIISLRVAQRGTHICPKCQSLNGTWRTPRRRQR
jgi:formamidopyrimidine-DNA glycosylase